MSHDVGAQQSRRFGLLRGDLAEASLHGAHLLRCRTRHSLYLLAERVRQSSGNAMQLRGHNGTPAEIQYSTFADGCFESFRNPLSPLKLRVKRS